MRHPIAILSFNRPHLLSAVVESLKNQTQAIDQSRVFLFQDGPRRASKDAPEDDTLQKECVATFRKLLPEGVVFEAEANLGIALNFERAERHMFETLKSECAYFFEDDLSLSPHYLAALDKLAAFALQEPLVAYAAAYGDHRATMSQQWARCSEIVPLGHKWGFALTRRQWLLQKSIVDRYLDTVRGADYRSRDAKKIEALFASFGYKINGTSQDAAKDIASLVLGTTKIMTVPCFGKYIGKEGVHFNQTLYEQHGYERTEMFEGPVPDFAFPSRATLEAWVRGAQAHARVDSGQPKPSASLQPTEAMSLKPRMTAPEIELYRHHVSQARHYLEFGCGGSTMVALEASQATVTAVESDTAWIEKLKQHPTITAAVAGRRLRFDAIDVGPVGAWGVPSSEAKIKKWPEYYISPWRNRQQIFDFILIDGRFRVMCALTALKYIDQDSYVAIHDYTERSHYYVVEKYFNVIQTVDTLVLLQRKPSYDESEWLIDYIGHMFDYR